MGLLAGGSGFTCMKSYNVSFHTTATHNPNPKRDHPRCLHRDIGISKSVTWSPERAALTRSKGGGAVTAVGYLCSGGDRLWNVNKGGDIRVDLPRGLPIAAVFAKNLPS